MEKKSIYICPEDCQDFRGEDGCGSGHIDTSFIYEKEGDYPICPFYSKPLMGMTLEKALDILTGNTEYTISEFNQAVRLGTEALKFFKDLGDRGALPADVRLPGEAKE